MAHAAASTNDLSRQTSQSSVAPSEPDTEAMALRRVTRRLARAAATGDLAALDRLDLAGVPLDTPDYEGMVPLERALLGSREEFALRLIKLGAPLDTVFTPKKSGKLSSQRTALHLAAQRGLQGVFTAILEQGVHVDLRDGRGDTALQEAVAFGQLEVTKQLLQHGANANACNELTQDTVLHTASTCCTSKAPKILELLLENGAKIDARNKNGETALYLAASQPAGSGFACAAVLTCTVAFLSPEHPYAAANPRFKSKAGFSAAGVTSLASIREWLSIYEDLYSMEHP